MDSFAILYLFYGATIGSQASIYFVWLANPSSATIAYVAAVVAVLSALPLFHVIIHVSLAKALSYPSFIAYACLSFIFAFLWHAPTTDTKQYNKSILPFALVTTCDLLALLILLLPHLSFWHRRTEDEENVGMRSDNIEGRVNRSRLTDSHNPSARPPHHRVPTDGVSQTNDTVRLRGVSPIGNFDRPDAGVSEAGGRVDGRVVPRSGGINCVIGRPGTEETETGGQQQGTRSQTLNTRADFVVDRGFDHIQAPRPVGRPAAIPISDIHPIFRSSSFGRRLETPQEQFTQPNTPQEPPSPPELRVAAMYGNVV